MTAIPVRCAKTTRESPKKLPLIEVSFDKAAPVNYLFYVKDFGVGSANLRYPEYFDETVREHQIKYLLKGIVTHEGPDRKSGHFRAFVKSGNRVWYMVN